MEKTQKIKFLVSFVFVVVFFVSLPAVASAATLYFSPSSGTHAVGTTFSVSVYVSSADQAMNAASGAISFPRDKLEVTSLSKTGSIFTLWVQEPSFSNTLGTVNFEGVVLNPGFTGSNGKAITITFRTKVAGNAPLTFSSGLALANDGAGTNILAGMGSASYQLSAAVVKFEPPVEQPVEKKFAVITSVPSATVIISSTHLDPDKWYSNKNPQFSWNVPAGVTGVSVYFSQSPTSNPGSSSDGIFASKTYENVEDGVWYYHIRMRNSFGWGPTAHFKIGIDTTVPPLFDIGFVDGKETDNPRPTIIFDVKDALSGIDYYKIKIGEGDFDKVLMEEIKDNKYVLPFQSPGKRSILVEAYDKAGNYSIANEEFAIRGLSEPIITNYQPNLSSEDMLVVSGKSQYTDKEITFWLQRESSETVSFTLPVDESGNFVFKVNEKLPEGVYEFWAQTVDARGAKSELTKKFNVTVAKPAIVRAGTLATNFLIIIIPLVLLVFVLVIVLWHVLRKFSSMRKRVQKEVHTAESALHNAFDLLRDGMQKQIRILERAGVKRELSKEEEKVIRQLKKDLDNAEKFIKKEIDVIDKEVK